MRILVIQDHKENRRKCSLTPIEGLEGVEILRLASPTGDSSACELGPGILLALGAPVLAPGDAALVEREGALVLLDSTWARLPKLERRLTVRPGAQLVRRSLPAALETAYPRVSKVHEDPAGGLASIEALYAATALLGSPWAALLRGYRWADTFLEKNRAQLLATSGASGVC